MANDSDEVKRKRAEEALLLYKKKQKDLGQKPPGARELPKPCPKCGKTHAGRCRP